jgi:hypothetical protein
MQYIKGNGSKTSLYEDIEEMQNITACTIRKKIVVKNIQSTLSLERINHFSLEN